MPPSDIDAVHEWEGGMCLYGGRKCLTRLLLLYCSHLSLHLLASINTWQHIYSFSQLHSIHASSCAQLFRHTTHTFSLLQLLLLSCDGFTASLICPCNSFMCSYTEACPLVLRLYGHFFGLFISVLWIYCLNSELNLSIMFICFLFILLLLSSGDSLAQRFLKSKKLQHPEGQ